MSTLETLGKQPGNGTALLGIGETAVNALVRASSLGLGWMALRVRADA